MPANLSPEYEKAEQRYRQAATDEERLASLQDMLSTIPKHKGTEKMQADIKRRLSQLRKQQGKPGHSKGPDPFHIPRSGAGQVAIIGPPNTGKSTLLAATTNAEARVADYPFTTALPQPGMWSREDVQIELVDTPPLTPDHVPILMFRAERDGNRIRETRDTLYDLLPGVKSRWDLPDATHSFNAAVEFRVLLGDTRVPRMVAARLNRFGAGGDQ